MQSSSENLFVLETCLNHEDTKSHFLKHYQKRFVMDRFMTTIQSISPQIAFYNFSSVINQVDFGFAFETNYRFRLNFRYSNPRSIQISLLKRQESKKTIFLRSTKVILKTYVHVIELPAVDYQVHKTNIICFFLHDDLSNMDDLCQEALNLMIEDKIL
jgi:hypothetical protein